MWGDWIRDAERKPPEYGMYAVRRKYKGGKIVNDILLYNGAYWVTHAGSVCRGVVEWKEGYRYGEDGSTTDGKAET